MGAAGTVFVGVDAAAHAGGAGFPRRDRVYLVGGDAVLGRPVVDAAGRETIVLPQGRAGSRRCSPTVPSTERPTCWPCSAGRVGRSASTLAAALAWRAAGRGEAVVLVGVDRLGGGLDLLLGAERVPGWRWPRFSGADGVLGDLREFLPVVDEIAAAVDGSRAGAGAAANPLGAVLGSLPARFRPGGDRRRSLWRATGGEELAGRRTVLVVGGSVRGVAAATRCCGCSIRPPARS
ncbi:MAG: hypothetical protein R2719_08320 [Micropruina sp.]